MSSEPRGRASGSAGVLRAALRAGERAVQLVSNDDEASYLANVERQLAIERLLIQFGEALKDVTRELLEEIDPKQNWVGPKAFRDIAAHWYEDGLDHRLIWRALQQDLPPMLRAIEDWLDSAARR